MITEAKLIVDGLSIHTRRSGKGPDTILFVHGNSCSSDYWDNQLNDPNLQKEFTLIAVDLPGHGCSDRAHDYSLKFMSNTLARIIQELSLSSYVLAGLSYGTALIAETALKLKNCKGFFLSSPNITSDAFPPTCYIIPFPELLTMVSETVEKDILWRFAAHLTGDTSSSLVEHFCKSYKETDPRFRVDLGFDMQNSSWSDEFKNLIDSELPVNYVFGENDLAIRTHYMDSIKLPTNHISHYIKEAAHFVNIDQAGEFNRLLKISSDIVLN